MSACLIRTVGSQEGICSTSNETRVYFYKWSEKKPPKKAEEHIQYLVYFPDDFLRNCELKLVVILHREQSHIAEITINHSLHSYKEASRNKVIPKHKKQKC